MRFPPILALTLSLLIPALTQAAEKPNVLLIMADDMGYSDLGCYGGEVDTPHLDALAADGLRFTQFYNTGRCWPSRISLMTGKYPHQAGHAMHFGPDAPRAYAAHTPDQGQMISEVLDGAGYHSYHVGKWHMDNRHIKDKPNPTYPLQRGFDHSYYVRSQHNFFNPHRMMDDDEPVEFPAGKDNPMGNGEYYLTTDFTNRTIGFLDLHKKEHPDSPFFLYLAHTAPHFPLHALPQDIERFMDGRYAVGWDEIRKQRHARMTEMGLINCSLSPRDPEAVAWDSLSDEEKKKWETHMAIHAAMIYRVDVGIGRIVEKLKANGQFDNTLILFLSDNGASAEYIVRGDGHDPEAPLGSGASYLCLEVGWANAANTPFREHKMWTHEGGISTPLIAHWPAGIQAKGLTPQMGHVIDVMPTVAELAELAPASGPGTSLVPIFEGKERPEPGFIHFEHTGNRALRKGKWKLVSEFGGEWELYDMSVDRSETSNLITEHPELAQEMQHTWQQYADEIGVVPWGTLPQSKNTPNADYRKK